ncbi:hypothetical protein Tco_0031904 [Tanacetum coccineum]
MIEKCNYVNLFRDKLLISCWHQQENTYLEQVKQPHGNNGAVNLLQCKGRVKLPAIVISLREKGMKRGLPDTTNSQNCHYPQLLLIKPMILDAYDSDCDELTQPRDCSPDESFPRMAQMHSLRSRKGIFNENRFDLKMILKNEEKQKYDREIALEKKIKQLDNIIFKRGQSAQTVHMMTKSKICYDHSTKQAIGFEKPFYLKKVQESKPKLYDRNVILKMDAIYMS